MYTDEQLEAMGFDLTLIEQERQLRDQIYAAQNEGDLDTASQLMRELILAQRSQPAYTGIKYRS
jgi:hypothetical protein